ncbi:hypothetical protein [Halorussus halobius]|uniref:hypothetical protein n=1 Tax=Halorussus halobius TaxID=1710537 RepID=UPI001092DFA8|nr:hypothetical protein [Halorussus halobius]
MTRKSKREIERLLDDLETEEPPEEPEAEWMRYVPEHLWSEPAEAWRAYIQRAEDDVDADPDGGEPTHNGVSVDV